MEQFLKALTQLYPFVALVIGRTEEDLKELLEYSGFVKMEMGDSAGIADVLDWSEHSDEGKGCLMMYQRADQVY